jgi:hypothetical protein
MTCSPRLRLWRASTAAKTITRGRRPIPLLRRWRLAYRGREDRRRGKLHNGKDLDGGHVMAECRTPGSIVSATETRNYVWLLDKEVSCTAPPPDQGARCRRRGGPVHKEMRWFQLGPVFVSLEFWPSKNEFVMHEWNRGCCLAGSPAQRHALTRNSGDDFCNQMDMYDLNFLST